MMRWLYLLSVSGYAFGVRIASLWNDKAKKWVAGRKAVPEKLNGFTRKKELPLYWFHCASLGEFEQARPLIEGLKERENCQVVITFFSPSGYEIRHNYDQADLVLYLPLEKKKNVAEFLDGIQPTLAFFAKYEFWATYLEMLQERKIKTYSVSAVFRKDQIFFKWYGSYMRKILRCFDQIFVQNEASKILLQEKLGIEAVLSGDTRYDRVMKNAQNVQKYPNIENWLSGTPCLVVGSSWDRDEEVIAPLIKSEKFNWKVILAPHEIHEKHLLKIESRFHGMTIRLSKLTESSEHPILIIDNIGMLSNLYQYGQVAYIGGAFGTGLHNILEPAAFGLKVVFGNQYEKFQEAYDFIGNGLAHSVNDSSEFSEVFQRLTQNQQKELVLDYMAKQTGACDQILSKI